MRLLTQRSGRFELYGGSSQLLEVMLLGLVAGYAISGVPIGIVTSLVFGIGKSFLGSTTRLVLASVLTFGSLVVCLKILGTQFGQFSSLAVALGSIALLVAFLVLLRSLPIDSESSMRMHPNDFSLVFVFLLLLFWLFWTRSTGSTGESSFYALASGEDNGTWLQWSHDIAATNRFSVTESVSSKLLLAITDLASTSPAGVMQPAMLLDRAYTFLMVCAAVITALVVRELGISRSVSWAGGAPMAAVVVLELSRRLVGIGHLTALVAVVTLLGLVLAASDQSSGAMKPVLQVVIVAQFSLVAYDAWYPLRGYTILVMIYCAVILVRHAFVLLGTREFESYLRIRTAGVLIGLVSAFIGVVVVFDLRWLPSLNELKRQLSIPGGYAEVSAILHLTILVGALAFILLGAKKTTKGSWFFGALLMLPVYTVIVRISSLVLVDFESYASNKLAGITTIVLAPLAVCLAFRAEKAHFAFNSAAIGWVAGWIVAGVIDVGHQDLIIGGISAGVLTASWIVRSVVQQRRPVKFNVLLGTALLPIIVGLSGPGFSSGLLREQSRETPPQILRGLARSLRENPQRDWVCHNSNQEMQEWSYETYSCTRLAAGLQGLNTKYNGAYLSFAAAQLCAVNVDGLRSIDHRFWRELGIVVNDARALTTTQYCQQFGWVDNPSPRDSQYPLGWASLIDWRTAEVRDPQGQVVQKSFDYLRGETGYEDAAIIDALNIGLLDDLPTAESLICTSGQSVFGCKARYTDGQVRSIRPERGAISVSAVLDQVSHRDDSRNEYCLTLYADQTVGFVLGRCPTELGL